MVESLINLIEIWTEPSLCIPWAVTPIPAFGRRAEGKFEINWHRSQSGNQDLCKDHPHTRGAVKQGTDENRRGVADGRAIR